MSAPRDEIENRPPNLTARDRAYGQPPAVSIRDNRPKPTPQPNAVELLATLVEQMAGLRGDGAVIHARVDEMAPRVAAAESSADMAYDEALAARKAIDTEVGPRVLGLFEHPYDLYAAIEDHDNATRPDATVVNISNITDTTTEED